MWGGPTVTALRGVSQQAEGVGSPFLCPLSRLPRSPTPRSPSPSITSLISRGWLSPARFPWPFPARNWRQPHARAGWGGLAPYPGGGHGGCTRLRTLTETLDSADIPDCPVVLQLCAFCRERPGFRLLGACHLHRAIDRKRRRLGGKRHLRGPGSLPPARVCDGGNKRLRPGWRWSLLTPLAPLRPARSPRKHPGKSPSSSTCSQCPQRWRGWQVGGTGQVREGPQHPEVTEPSRGRPQQFPVEAPGTGCFPAPWP